MRLNETLHSLDYKELERLLFYDKFMNAIFLVSRLTWYVTFVVDPIIGITGIIGNVIGLLVITKCGLNRTSNVLLFYLTLGDILCLTGSVNVPLLVTRSSDTAVVVWALPYIDARLVATLYMLIMALSKAGYAVSIHISIWMMVERLLAVFFPLTFRNLVTPPRVWLLGFFLLFASCAWNVYSLPVQYTFIYGKSSNMTGGIYSVVYDSGHVLIKIYITFVFLYLIPVAVVVCGCVVISVKLARSRENRFKLTTSTRSQRPSTRVTVMFLIICVKISLSQIILIPKHIFLYIVRDFSLSTESFVFFAVSSTDVFDFINSACDCIIYVACNKQFRSIFLHYLPFHRH